jgi:hypothetical protein
MAATACGSSKGGPNEPDKPATEEKVSEDDKSWGGWRWKGSRDDCFFVHANRCFDDKAKACKAAGCTVKACELHGGGPATVKCKK